MKRIIISLMIIMGLLLVACSTDEDKVDTTQESKQENNVSSEDSFKELDILSIEQEDEDRDSYEDIITTFKITNNGKEPIKYVSLDFAYYDKSGNCICTDGRYHDTVINPGKSALIKTYSEGNKDTISDVKVTSYEYELTKENSLGVKEVSLNIATKEVERSENSENTVEENNFEKLDVISIQEENSDRDSYEDIITTFKITNNGDIPIKYVSLDFAYYDKSGNCICTDARYNDTVINPGKSALVKTYSEGNKDTISEVKVTNYEYKLTKENSLGMKEVNLNIETKEVE